MKWRKPRARVVYFCSRRDDVGQRGRHTSGEGKPPGRRCGYCRGRLVTRVVPDDPAARQGGGAVEPGA
jgi:hypothetical protein